MGAIGKFVTGTVGAVGGFLAGGPAGAIAGASLGYQVGSSLERKKSGGGSSHKPPPVLPAPPQQTAIAPAIQPLNLVQIMDTITNNKMQIVRGADNKLSVMFQGSRIPLDGPIDTGKFNPNLPAVRSVKGRDIQLEAGAVIALIQEMKNFSGALEEMERTAPSLIPQNKELLESFKSAQNLATERGFDLKQSGLEQTLSKMGILNSSTGLGAQIALANQKADTIIKNNLEYNLFAQDAKTRTQEAMYKRGENIANTANVELNRYVAQTSNELEMRDQDMRTEVQIQALEQERAAELERLNLSRNDQLINAELGRRQIAFNQQNADENRLLQTGLSLFNSGNDHAIGARSVDNTAAANLNNANLNRYRLQSNPYQAALHTGMGNFIGAAGTEIGTGFGRRAISYFNSDGNNDQNQRTLTSTGRRL